MTKPQHNNIERFRSESLALIGKVFDSFETDIAPSIHAVRNAISNPNLLMNGDF